MIYFRKVPFIFLISILALQCVFTYAYLHVLRGFGYHDLQDILIFSSSIAAIFAYFSIKHLWLRIAATLTYISFIIWIGSVDVSGGKASFLLYLFILSPKILPMIFLTLSLMATILIVFWRTISYRYFAVFVASLIFFSMLAATILPQMSLAYLKHSYQIAPVTEIAKLQQEKGGYYLPDNAEYQYKMALYKLRKPDIITLGTSRVLGFRQYMFNVPFVNMGRTFGSLQMLKTIDDILAIHKPKVIILGLDWWDFIRPGKTQWKGHQYDGTDIIPAQLISPYEWIFDGKITLTQFIDGVLGKNEPDTDVNSYGVPARHHVSGYAKDGSIYYFSILNGPPNSSTYQFREGLANIAAKHTYGEFEIGNSIPAEKWKQLSTLRELLKKNQVKLIIYLPPEPVTIIQALNKAGSYGYIDELRHSHKKFGPNFYDYFDPRVIHASDCEFIDEYHSDDIVAMRVLLALSHHSDNQLSELINKDKIKHLVSLYAGRAAVPFSGSLPYAETDFLGLGCKKGRKNLDNKVI